jgi:hypothetical protein
VETGPSQERTLGEAAESSMVPQVLLGAVDGVGVVAGGLLQLTRNVLLSAVSGAADIGAEALTATVSGTRGIVSAASRMVGNMAGAAQTSFQEAVSTARQSGSRTAARSARRPLARMAGRTAEPTDTEGRTPEDEGDRRTRAARQPRAGEAA